MSESSFKRHVQPELRIVRRGSLRIIPVTEIEKWLESNATMAATTQTASRMTRSTKRPRAVRAAGGMAHGVPSVKRPDWAVDPAILRRRAYKRWDDAGLDRLGFHEGRHTFASIAIAAGLNAKTISTYMGQRSRSRSIATGT